MPLKSAFFLFGDVENENFEGIGSERPMKTQFTQLFVLISNFELRIINFDLAVPIRAETGAWIGV